MATPSLLDPNFWRTVVLLIHGDEDGHVGLILNRPTLAKVEDHLEAWSGTGEDAHVYFGGPVEPDMAVTLVEGEEGEATGLRSVSIGDATGPPAGGVRARIYAGYAGWGSGQLNAEIAEGAWVVLEANPADPFGEPDGMWHRVLQRQGGKLSLMATFPADASLN